MSFAAHLPAAILDTILARLALLFLAGANGDHEAALNAASRMLSEYKPDNADELRLAAEIISFSLHSLEALSQAANQDIALNLMLRLQNSAVRLSRASQAAQKRLDQCRKARRTETQPETPAEPEQLPPKLEQNPDLIAAPPEPVTAARTSGQTWTQAYDQRQRDKRLQASQITETLRKNHALQMAQPNLPPIMTSPPEQPEQR